jgi:hypothetical protein
LRGVERHPEVGEGALQPCVAELQVGGERRGKAVAHGDRHLGLLQGGFVARGAEAGEGVGEPGDLGGVDVAQQRGVELHELLDELGVPRDHGLRRGVGPGDHVA